MKRVAIILAVLVIAGLMLWATVGGGFQGSVEDRLEDEMVAAGLPQPMAECMAGRMADRLSIGQLRKLGFIAAGPRSPQPGAPYTYVTTPAFLSQFGFETLRDLPDFENLEDAGLLSKDRLMAGDLMPSIFSETDGEQPALVADGLTVTADEE